MVEMHDNRATQVDVAGKFHQSLSKTRAEHQSVAHREFEQGDT